MTLKRRFQVLVVALVIAPLLATVIVGWVTFSLNRENTELTQFLQSRRWIEDTVEQQLMAGIIPSPVFDAPARIVVIRGEQEVVFSSVAGIVAGDLIHSPLTAFRRALGNPQKIAVDRVVATDGTEFQVVREVPKPPPRNVTQRTAAFWIPMISFVILVVASSLIGSLVMNRFQRRVFGLQQATRRIADGDLGTPVSADGNDELTQLANDLNSMRAALKEDLARRSRFLMGVSHDLATPLTTIKGYLEALRDGVVTGAADTGRSLDAMWTKAELLEERVSELIGFVRLETGEWRMQQSNIDLVVFLQSLASSLGPDTEVLKRRFESKVDLPEGVSIMGDPRLLERVFENLYHNAVRYTKEGDTIRLTAETGTGDAVVVTLEDSGPGLGDGDPTHLFEPFTRGTNSRNEPGFGLGLATVRSILDSHGFEISAGRSELGGGAFRITMHRAASSPSK
ncbi:MAG TPA: HAMP domain-containing sensor histidine kinase [Spirochaetia bacterium]|nr:HAMP domain-containing sensor histidine kinase [Spirochaetia bacterium]